MDKVRSEESAVYMVDSAPKEKCSFCDGWEKEIFGYRIELVGANAYLQSGDLWSGLRLKIDYCPLCGRKLT